MTTVTMIDRHRAAELLVVGPRLVCSGLAAELGDSMHSVRHVVDLSEAARSFVDHGRPDVVLVVIAPHSDSIAALARLLESAAGVPVIAVLVEPATRPVTLAILETGVAGFQMLGEGPEAIAAAVAAVRRGQAALHPSVTRWLLDSWNGHSALHSTLTAREFEVLQLVVKGLQNKQIAHRLAITERTVKCHLSRVYQSIGVRSRTEAALWLAHHDGLHASTYPSAS